MRPVVRLSPFLLVVVFALHTLDPAAVDARPGPSPSPFPDLTPWRFFEQLRDGPGGPSADLTDFHFRQDVLELSFSSGRMTLLEVDGVAVGAILEGPGHVSLAPSDAREQAQLRRFFDAPRVDLDVRAVLLLADSSTLTKVRHALPFDGESGAPSGLFRDVREDGLKYLMGARSGRLDEQVVRTLLNGEGGGFLHVHLMPHRGNAHFVRISSLSAEEVTFGRPAPGGDQYEVLSAFHLQEDPTRPEPTEEDTYGAMALRYEIESRITGRLDFQAKAVVHLHTEVERGAWIPFYLSADLQIDSLLGPDGTALEWERRGRTDQLWTRLPADPGVLSLTAWYSGTTVRFRDMWYWLDEPTAWYPRTGRTEATFDMVFHTPSNLELLGSGVRSEYSTTGNETTSRWVIARPASQASFSLGDFVEHAFGAPGLPPLRLHYHHEFHRRLLASDLVRQERDVAEAVANDLASALSFFQGVYGPVAVQEFNASEIPYLHGQAFPGLIHLSYLTFLSRGTNDEGGNESFRAHEVAHQWWGFSVEPRSDRDRWLSEGLAEFSGLWFMQVVRGHTDPGVYDRALEASRDRILDRRGRTGPISLGSRVGVGGRDEDYMTVIYEKGAWVIHMLRTLLTDMDSMDDGAFVLMIRDVADRFREGRLSTDEFQAVVEDHLDGTDMQWFFDQWVHGTDIPTYSWAWTGEEVAGGYRLTVRVRQQDVPDDFRMLVPITVDFPEGSATVRMLVTGPETVGVLPLLPQRPSDVRFNDLNGVLARVRSERW